MSNLDKLLYCVSPPLESTLRFAGVYAVKRKQKQVNKTQSGLITQNNTFSAGASQNHIFSSECYGEVPGET